MKKVTLLLLLIFPAYLSFSQKGKDKTDKPAGVEAKDKNKDLRTTYEEIKVKCKDTPADKRLRITVSSFKNTTRNAPTDFGDNMRAMLSNALFETNCFTVLESQKNMADVEEEINFSNSGGARKDQSIKRGQLQSAQILAIGELTEYSRQKKTATYAIVKTSEEITKLGFNLKLVDPMTREIKYSKSFNVEVKTGSGTSVGVRMPFAGRAEFGGASNMDQATADAMEQGVIQGVEFIVQSKEQMQASGALVSPGSKTTSDAMETVVSISGASMSTTTSFKEFLKGIPSVKNYESSFSGGVAKFVVSHTGTSEKLATDIDSRGKSNYEVTGFEEGLIQLRAK